MNPNNTISPYVWAAVILILIATVLIGVILFLRPAADPLVVMTAVGGFVTATGSGIMAFMKAQETHAIVNSRLDEMIATQNKSARAEGVIKGAAEEQARTQTPQV